MKKNRIVITYRNHNYLARVLEHAPFLWWRYWRTVVAVPGPLRVITPAIINWCKEFNIDIKEVEDQTI